MNRNNPQSLVHRAKDIMVNVGRKLAVGSALAVTAVPAFAQVDTSAIEAEFNTYKVAVIALVIAFAVVLWAIRGAGLLKPRS